jgi:head-tail adaptor
MRAGRLRHRVVIQRKTVTQNAFGEEVITWTTVGT